MPGEYYQARTAAGALLAEYRWHSRMDCLVQRFAMRWAGFARDGFVINPLSLDHVEKLVSIGSLVNVPVPAPWRLEKLLTTKITPYVATSQVLAICEVGDSYLVQSGTLPQLTTDDVLTRNLTDMSSWAFGSWRGAVAQSNRIVDQSRLSVAWEVQDHAQGEAWPERILAAVRAEQVAQAAKPSQVLNAGEFAARMRAMRAKGAKL